MDSEAKPGAIRWEDLRPEMQEHYSGEHQPWHYNHPDFKAQPHSLKPDGRGQGMRVCTQCGETEPEPDKPCQPRRLT